MLVLSRKLLGRIYVTCPDGSLIEVVVVDIDRGKIRLGVTAPLEYLIEREEIRARRLAEVPADAP